MKTLKVEKEEVINFVDVNDVLIASLFCGKVLLSEAVKDAYIFNRDGDCVAMLHNIKYVYTTIRNSKGKIEKLEEYYL